MQIHQPRCRRDARDPASDNRSDCLSILGKSDWHSHVLREQQLYLCMCNSAICAVCGQRLIHLVAEVFELAKADVYMYTRRRNAPARCELSLAEQQSLVSAAALQAASSMQASHHHSE